MTVIKHFHSTLFHLTPFLRKYYLLILKKLRTVMMYQPRLLKQMLICFQFLCPMLLMNLSFLVNFCRFWNWLMLNQSIRKNQGLKKLTINQLVYYLTFQKFFKDACIDKFQNILKLCYQNFNVVFKTGIAPKIVTQDWTNMMLY